MSIRFVSSLDEEPKHQFVEVGTKILFKMINGLAKPYEVIEPDGTQISIGITVTAA